MEAVQRELEPNPRDGANILSQIFLIWTAKIFKVGYRKVLDVTDLFRPLHSDQSDVLGDRLEANWYAQQKNKKPSLLKAVFKTFWKDLAIMAVLAAIADFGVRLFQPLVLGQLLSFFRLDVEVKDPDARFYWGGTLVFLSAVGSITFNHYTMIAFHTGMRIRVAVCSLIYRKALRLSRTALGQTAPGKVVNLLSNDVSRFDLVSIFVNAMWSAPLLTIIIAVMLYLEIGYSGLIGMIVIAFVVFLQSYTGKLSSKFRYQTAIRTDERVRFMDEIISGIQVIKMYAWEKPFARIISFARQVELKVVRKNTHVRALYMTFNLFTTRAAIFITIMTLVLSGGDVSATKVFVVTSYYNILSGIMSQMFVRGVAEMAEAFVSFKRLQTFLDYEEKEVNKKDFLNQFGMNGDAGDKVKENGVETLGKGIALQLKHATAKWSAPDPNSNKHSYETKKKTKQSKKLKKLAKKNGNTPAPEADHNDRLTLDDVSIDFKKGKLIGIIGAVGSGKSSLLQVILEELPLKTGSATCPGKISYACQEPWVFSGTVRQNILFGQEMEKIRYDSVVKACALIKDFEQFPEGDMTVIGDKGASLSGGQKARINLARAVYRQADVYLLDDPLSAVDAHVGRHLFEQVIGPTGRLARRHVTRVLVTHQIHFLKEADWIVVLNDGKIEMQGTPGDLSKSDNDFAQLLEQDVSDEEDEEEKETDDQTMISSSRRSSTKSVSASRNTLSGKEAADGEKGKDNHKEQAHQMEATSKGVVKGSISWNYIKAGGSIVLPFVVVVLYALTQMFASFTDWWVSFFTEQEEMRTYYSSNNISVEITSPFNENFDQVKNITKMVEVFNSTLNMTLTEAEEETVGYLVSTDFLIAVHGTIVVLIFLIGILRSIGFFTMAVRASQKMHDGMFSSLIRAPMRFFDTNPSGRILNRFSKDMGAVDELLPKAILDAGQIILNMIGAIIVTTTVQPIFLILVCVLGVIFWFIRKVYLKTSKNLKRLDGITRSPVFTHLAASLNGLSTIRAYGAQTGLIKEFDAHQDIHTASYYMYISTSTAFGLSLDIVCLVFLCCVTFYFLIADDGAMGGQVGLAITQTMSITGLLQWGIRQSAEVANQLMAVERVLEYRDLEQEKQPMKLAPITKDWPTAGKIEFRQVVYRYYEGAEAVLKGLNFVIYPKEKIGIVGRTGAGKSSLIGAIFRLAKVEGDILIDGVNSATISLENLRSHVSIIPQDPVLFSGTIRRNLDPFEEYPDSALWQALEAVELKDIASGSLGLQGMVATGGGNFSVGQRQLVCLARAILRNNKILVLDEATANVDPHTDSLIQKTIRERFADCTVLTIAHRLHTIMDSDRILVMNFGLVEEFDIAHTLLQKPNGLLRDMVMTTGPQESERLIEMAKEKYESMAKIM
ncbi:multidrug resistance-associated protein 4-like isoform X2 [Hermetia illucens]|uniref:multidrug resistance-associated protein 4-like isoform X2 n=1 Tax=Hermetia illucens TaxID=343691 RepID=UPI0018CC16B9|nr:multidrug resistance-associated protein 4-like isoform X2 [Hermetia illucens]